MVSIDADRAIDYLYRHGRPVDQRLHELETGAGTADDVLDALGRFQNEDGGFGHGLEADLRTPASSAIATSTAFAVLRRVGAPSDHPMVRQAVRYYLDTYDPDAMRWRIVPPEVEQSPRAPWWRFDRTEESFGGFLHNPRAAILAHLSHHPELVPAAFLTELTELQLAALEDPSYEPDMFDLDCYVQLAAAPLSAEVRERVRSAVDEAVHRLVDLAVDPGATEMSLTPLRIAPSPAAPLADLFEPSVLDAHLDSEADRQLEDGSWDLGWDWSEVDAVAWARAERDWKGHVIVSKLAMFRAYGRL